MSTRFAARALSGLTHPGDADYGAQGRSEWLDVDWSRHRRRITIDGREIEYVDMGSGDTVLMVHGLAMCWQCWLENIPFFARKHRVIAVDLPGFGRSEMPAEKISIAGYARALDELCERLDLQRATVVGNSMGGFVGAELTIRYPQRVERLGLVAAAMLWQEYRHARPLVSLAQAAEATLGRAIIAPTRSQVRRPRLRAGALGFAGLRYPHLIPRELQAELLLTARPTAGFVPALEALANYPLRQELPQIACPTLIVWGAHDPLVGVGHARELERLIPGARQETFERTGHMPMIERPARFNRVVAEFMATTGRPTAAERAAATA